MSAADTWLPVTELATARGITKGPMSRRVARLEQAGLIHPRRGEKGTKLVNLAEFDKAAAMGTDAVREANGKRASAAEPVADGSLAREQARKAAAQATILELALAVKLGEVVPLAEVRESSTLLAEVMMRALDGLVARAEEFAALVPEGADAATIVRARSILRKIVVDTRKDLAAHVEAAVARQVSRAPLPFPLPPEIVEDLDARTRENLAAIDALLASDARPETDDA